MEPPVLGNYQVEPGTTAAMILGHEAIRSPAGYQARLVPESAQTVAGLLLRVLSACWILGGGGGVGLFTA